MRFLHTSDWHLGRTLRGFELHTAQAAAVHELVDAAIAAKCDAFIIAGDVFDRAVPPVESIALFSDVLRRLDDAEITSIVIAGNHDSGTRLAVYSSLLNDRVHIVGDPVHSGTPIEVGDALIYPLPYLNPDEARLSFAEDEPLPRSHHAVMEAAVQRVRNDRAERAHAGPVIAVAHAFVAGGAASESERDISVGGVPVVGFELFDEFSYVALGHLHRPQSVHDRMHYSGSLLRYSISEAEHIKRAVIVDLVGKDISLEDVEITQPRPMVALSGTMTELLAMTEHGSSFVDITVTDEQMPERMYPRLQSAFPYAMQIRRAARAVGAAGTPSRGTASGKSAQLIIEDFILKTTGAAVTEAEREIIRVAIESVG